MIDAKNALTSIGLASLIAIGHPTSVEADANKANFVYYYIQKADGTQDLGWNNYQNAITLKLNENNGRLSWSEGPRAYSRSDMETPNPHKTVQIAFVTTKPDNINEIDHSCGALTIPRQEKGPMYIPSPTIRSGKPNFAQIDHYDAIFPIDNYYIGVQLETNPQRHDQKILLTDAWKKNQIIP